MNWNEQIYGTDHVWIKSKNENGKVCYQSFRTLFPIKKTKKEWIDFINNNVPDYLKGHEILDVVNGDKYHVCPYCNVALVEGNDKDKLCYNCTTLFGHARYSEL